MVVFMIVGKNEPLYELEIGGKSIGDISDELSYLHQFIMFSSLDLINNAVWTNSATFLRVVDRFNYLMVSAYASQGGILLLLLHNGKSEDAVRAFFAEVHELYVKYLMNPFVIIDAPIISPHFDSHVKTVVRKYVL